ncbi:NAD(P)-binding protein [Roseomonas sp. GC11]|uniref:NAD(P)/FAD-dependent oxidoreductase n=1 Tax=Roseomonas sp. GC11 TaxID=2950546 RepID=UPI00210BA0C6|nr:NAD(P)-binding protein [Roseomonas sp. GC11]MCQ4160803.1 NAD(P)-binding protein [Roseomonas sp. GC11]
MTQHPIAILGAGLAGLACAHALRRAGQPFALFDKGRAAGGRLATRRSGALRYDHGAQYLTARGPGLAAWLAEGSAAWPQPGAFLPVPGMSALPRRMAEGLPLHSARHVTTLEPSAGGWHVLHHDAALVRPGHPLPDAPPQRSGPFSAVVVTFPAPQAAALLATAAPALAEALRPVRLAPCWTLMAAFDAPLPLPDLLQPNPPEPIAWAARESAKPGREAGERWVIQAGPEASRAWLEDSADSVTRRLLAALGAPAPRESAAHRWRHARVEVPLGQPCLWDPALRLGVAGDGCLAPRAEAAFDSGEAVARAILA